MGLPVGESTRNPATIRSASRLNTRFSCRRTTDVLVSIPAIELVVELIVHLSESAVGVEAVVCRHQRLGAVLKELGLIGLETIVECHRHCCAIRVTQTLQASPCTVTRTARVPCHAAEGASRHTTQPSCLIMSIKDLLAVRIFQRF